jgi:hypothetical protein
MKSLDKGKLELKLYLRLYNNMWKFWTDSAIGSLFEAITRAQKRKRPIYITTVWSAAQFFCSMWKLFEITQFLDLHIIRNLNLTRRNAASDCWPLTSLYSTELRAVNSLNINESVPNHSRKYHCWRDRVLMGIWRIDKTHRLLKPLNSKVYCLLTKQNYVRTSRERLDLKLNNVS